MNIPIQKRVHIAFWDFAIETLSENKPVRGVIKSSYRLAHNQDLKRIARLLMVSAAAGMMSGFVLCVFAAYFWK